MKIQLRSNGRPAYVQIAEELRLRIASGRLATGDRLPTERELAAQLGVSRMTVRHALSTLRERGLLVPIPGRGGGTFVARPKLVRDLGTFSGLSEQLRRQGLHAGARVISARRRRANATVAESLELAPSSAVAEIVRVRLADGDPFALERSFFPFPDLLQHDLEGSLYDVLADSYDAAPVRAVERLEPVVASAIEARLLGVRRAAPLMLVERTAYSAEGTPVEFARDLFHGARTRVVAWTSEFERE